MGNCLSRRDASSIPETAIDLTEAIVLKRQLLVVDHLADGSMTSVANYVKQCELQNTQNTGTLNAHGRLV